ncbi:MAG TPA: FGGY family carbohydrate kinase [Opitutus sp.]|nr:FGGY family carbohydrate kinase [Opitutus sp.]
MFFLALDQSTSATKALLFDAAGQTLDREARDHAQHYPQPGWVEHDAEEIWANSCDVRRRVHHGAISNGYQGCRQIELEAGCS